MDSMTLPNLTASNFARAGKDSKDDAVSASRQAEHLELTGADAVRLAQQGDAAAFERIYRLHSRKIYTPCLRMAGDPTDAEDLTQDEGSHITKCAAVTASRLLEERTLREKVSNKFIFIFWV